MSSSVGRVRHYNADHAEIDMVHAPSLLSLTNLTTGKGRPLLAEEATTTNLLIDLEGYYSWEKF